MNEQTKESIEQLAATAHKAHERFRQLGMMNTPRSAEDAMLAAQDYAVAKAEMFAADRALAAALSAPGVLPK